MKTAVNPPEFFDSLQQGFSQIVIAEGKRTAYFAGQVAWDANKRVVGKGDFAAQVEKHSRICRLLSASRAQP